jgi:glycosyltransferase involved in cell wall biosynthesis
MAAPSRISVVIPVHNEQDDVAELAAALGGVLPGANEIIFVDDGSTDQTWERLKALHDPGRVRLLRFRANFGKTAALVAGFAASRGEVVFTMDGDLQDDPAEIPRFLQKMDEGFDLVSGWKRRRHDPPGKVIPSRIFNFVVRKTTGLALHDINCGFKCYRGELARSLRLYGEQHRFIPVFAATRGYAVGEIEVRHHPRKHGRSKYGFSRLFKGFFDLVTVLLITRFAERPSHGFGFAAAALAGVAACTTAAAFAWPAIPVIGPLAAAGWLGALVLLAAGWVAETVVAQGNRGEPFPHFDIEEQLD